MTEIPHDRVSLDDDEFVDRLAQEFGKVSHLDPYFRNLNSIDTYLVTHEEDLAEIFEKDFFVWALQTFRAMPRILDVVRKAIDAAEAADAEKDDLIASIVKEARLGFD